MFYSLRYRRQTEVSTKPVLQDKLPGEAEEAISDWNSNTEDDDKMIYFNAYEVVSEWTPMSLW